MMNRASLLQRGLHADFADDTDLTGSRITDYDRRMTEISGMRIHLQKNLCHL